MMTERTPEKDMERFLAALRRRGMRATRQRIAVHGVMLRLVHATADEVYGEICNAGKTDATLAGVHRILGEMADLGIYARRLSAGEKKVYDVRTVRHIHLYDAVNNRYRDLMDKEIVALVQERLARKRYKGFTVDGVEISVVCHPTRRRKKLPVK